MIKEITYRLNRLDAIIKNGYTSPDTFESTILHTVKPITYKPNIGEDVTISGYRGRVVKIIHLYDENTIDIFINSIDIINSY